MPRFNSSASSSCRFLAAQTWFARLPRLVQIRVDESLVRLSASRGDVMLHANEKVVGCYAVLSQDELASLVGVSRRTANRALQSLAQRGLVTLEFGRVDIADDDALMRFIFSPPEKEPGLRAP